MLFLCMNVEDREVVIKRDGERAHGMVDVVGLGWTTSAR